MPLPSITAPTYTLQIPSIKKEIKYRPFLVKEEKILIIAIESEDPTQITDAVKTILSNCILTKGIKVDQLAIFDIEYLFLNVRCKSMGETVDVLITCPDDGVTKVPVSIQLDEIKIKENKDHLRDIQVRDDLILRMKYPSLKEFIKTNFSNKIDITVNETFELIASCIEQVYSKDESWNASDCSKKELLEFVDNLSPKHFREIERFFETMPKLSHTLKIKNPNTDVESEVIIEGLTSFLA